MDEKEELELFQFCTEDINLDGGKGNSTKMNECFQHKCLKSIISRI